MFRRKGMLSRSERWQQDYLFELGGRNWLLHAILVLLVGSVLIVSFPSSVLPYVWTLTLLALSGTISLLCSRQVQSPHLSDEGAQHAENIYWVLTGCVGVVWGLGAWGAVGYGNFQVVLVFTLAMCGTGVSSVPVQHASPRLCLTSIWTGTLLLASANLARELSLIWLINAGIVLLFGVVLTLMCERMFNFLKTSMALNASLDSKVAELMRLTEQLGQARHAAEEANLSKSRFLAQASHDLRQPIHAIGLFTACLRDAHLAPAERKMIDNIDRSLDSATRLFASLLDISRLDVGGITPHPVPLSLRAFIDEMIHQNSELAAASGCTIRKQVADIWVDSDPALLSTLIQNLLSNAFKYAPGTELLVGTRLYSDDTIGLMICDRGPGIDEDKLDTVFEEFYRIESATQRVEGLGLGLAIVRRIAGILKLEVNIRSRHGYGTAVRIKGLNRAARSTPKPAPHSARHSIEGMSVVLIDNDLEILGATEALLRTWGCKVKAHARAPRSIEPCDVLVVDYDLGTTEDGLAVVNRLRRQHPHQQAIIISGRSEGAIIDEINHSGIPLLSKPMRPAEFRSILTHVRQRNLASSAQASINA